MLATAIFSTQKLMVSHLASLLLLTAQFSSSDIWALRAAGMYPSLCTTGGPDADGLAIGLFEGPCMTSPNMADFTQITSLSPIAIIMSLCILFINLSSGRIGGRRLISERNLKETRGAGT